jgi:hypothetical protein
MGDGTETGSRREGRFSIGSATKKIKIKLK